MFIHTDTAIDTDNILVRFKCSTKVCPNHGVIVESSVTNIVECGNPMCESCEDELSSLGVAFVR